jgi:inosine/xanthosine triphosphate pyrophosphatase family protein/2-polyprenyl-3-methyl-5-hydroxy-6-metoxy-1,4-benzoquinol methylase
LTLTHINVKLLINMKHVFYATSNKSKFTDAKIFLSELNPELTIEQLPIEIPEIQSDNHDDIIEQKVEFVRKSTAAPFIVDDSSFYTERFPAFPGAYAKFLNNSLGNEGWRRLFSEGDKIRAVARIALYNFGDVQYFNGEIEGSLSFDQTPSNGTFSLNDHIIVEGGRLLRDALSDPTFLNHRRTALLKLSDSVLANNTQSNDKKLEIGERWSSRAATWKDLIEDNASYVNYENNYERVNTLIKQYGPLAKGKALEVGCGTGEAGRILKTSNPALEILSTDIAGGMLAEAQKQTAEAGLDIEYKQLDITDETLGDEKFGIVISRGVVVSHLPKSNIYDFLESMARHTDTNGYLLFDFIQNTSVGEIEKPVDTKNKFTLQQMDELLSHFGMKRIDNEGNDTMRVQVVCYQHLSPKVETQ